MIDSKTLKGTKNDVLYVDNVRFTWAFQCFLNNHHIADYFNISTVWGLILGRFGGLVGVRLGILACLGAVLGRFLDATFNVLELCAMFGWSPEAVCNIRAALHEVVSQLVDP